MTHHDNHSREFIWMDDDQYHLEEISDFIGDNDNVDCDQVKQHILGKYYHDNNTKITKIKQRLDFLFHDEMQKQHPDVGLLCSKSCQYQQEMTISFPKNEPQKQITRSGKMPKRHQQIHNGSQHRIPAPIIPIVNTVPILILIDEILSKFEPPPSPKEKLERCSQCKEYDKLQHKLCRECVGQKFNRTFSMEYHPKLQNFKSEIVVHHNDNKQTLQRTLTTPLLLDDDTNSDHKKALDIIKTEIQTKMKKILGDKTGIDIKRQSSEESCCSYQTGNIHKINQLKQNCEPLKRITIILYAYHRLINEIHKSEWNKIDIGDIIQIEIGDNDIYGHQQIYNDFYHMIYVHIVPDNNANRSCDHDEYDLCKYENIGAKICQYLEEQCKCKHSDDLQQCAAFTRHYRERTNDETEQHLYCEKVEEGENKKERENEIALMQECDKMHSYFLHSTIKFGTESDETNAEQEAEIDRISELPNIIRTSKSYVANSSYIGKKEDDLWWKNVTLEKNSKSEDQDEIYRNLVENVGVFRWQNPHGFGAEQNRAVSHYRPKYKNIKDEALQNEYEPLSKDNWNQTLRKATIFFKSWARQKIRATYKGYFDDQVTGQKEKWDKGIAITMQEIVILKLYTDFDKLQFALKKCFRFETFDDILDQKREDENARQDLENRLGNFYHWRGGILIVLNKFGTKINHENNMVLYHGVNAKMIMKPSQTLAFNGPLSTTSSYHVARTFATAKGMVLKITSHFPRMNFCNAFDASLISDYPEEQEWLVGFMYVRLLEVRTRKFSDNVESFWDLISKVPISSWLRELFFAIHLFNEQIFSMSEHLERVLAQFLKVNRKECCDENKIKKYQDQYAIFKDWNMDCVCHFICKMVSKHKGNGMVSKYSTKPMNEKDAKIKADHAEDLQKGREIFFPILWKKFNEFRQKPNLKQRIKFDTISDHLKRFFMEQIEEKDINTDKKKWVISFDEITTVYPNVEEIHFINQYKFDEHVLERLIKQIKKGKELQDEEKKEKDKVKENQNTIKKIVFLYYNYKQTDKSDDKNKPLNRKIFKDPDHLDTKLIAKLEKEGWKIKHNKNGKTGYKIRVYNAKM